MGLLDLHIIALCFDLHLTQCQNFFEIGVVTQMCFIFIHPSECVLSCFTSMMYLGFSLSFNTCCAIKTRRMIFYQSWTHKNYSRSNMWHKNRQWQKKVLKRSHGDQQHFLKSCTCVYLDVVIFKSSVNLNRLSNSGWFLYSFDCIDMILWAIKQFSRKRRRRMC